MKLPLKRPSRDASFFQYKLMQIIGLLILSLVIYCIYVFFDLGKYEDKQKIMTPMSKDELRPQNMFKKYLKPEKPVK